jgi:hypothetical protein
MALSDSQTGRRPFWRRSGPRPPANPEPPSLTQTTFPTCRAHYPGGPDQVLVGWRGARSRAGFFPVRVAFPVIGAGRRPHPYFRGLLKLHTRYGLQSCSPTIHGLYREASPWPVSRLGRSQATKFNQQPPWVGPAPTGDLRLWGARRVEVGREHWRLRAAPFPNPAHQTGRADFPHPAFRLASS